jgi:hemerythrin-like domain-containing protein
MGENFQAYRAAVNAAKGLRQFEKADDKMDNDDVDSAVRHFDKGLNFLATALDHLEKAEDDAYDKAADEIGKGNAQIQKCLDACSGDNVDGAVKHYEKALEHYDAALDELDA